MVLCCRPTHRVGIPVTQVENVDARRTGSGKTRAKQQHSTTRCHVSNHSTGQTDREQQAARV